MVSDFAIEPKEYRRVMGHWPTGVSIVTGVGGDGEPWGMVIGSFTSVSLDPPLVAFCPMRTSTTWSAMREGAAFVINILADDQSALVDRFSRGDARGRFSELNWDQSSLGLPILRDSLAWIEARTETEHDGGDHVIVVGRVTEMKALRSGDPLVFARGRLGRFVPMIAGAPANLPVGSGIYPFESWYDLPW